ncbi:unnamed protein product [Danaus chrysippus]|uniref:(African queen) hypothetical protein n=1 Tax=Danaus chrysippus TaxID=151541 RepID=A0A8J2W022_9NEOP|nr:unnamed protein product [Danaus chrysippus]
MNDNFTIEDTEDTFRTEIIAELIQLNLKNNGWSNIYMIGKLPDELYSKLKTLPFTFTTSTIDTDDEDIEDVLAYHSNMIVISCSDFDEFEDAIRKAMLSPYWHPLANIILDYHTPLKNEIIAKIFFAFFFHQVVNVIIIHNNNNSLLISHYNQFITENYKLQENFGCWTSSKATVRIDKFETGFTCVQDCHNVSLHSLLRSQHLGTCIGFNTEVIFNKTQIKSINFFEDKAKNMHGYTMRAYAIEVLPFFIIKPSGNGSFTLHSRDGMIWNTMAELFNFKIDLSPSRDVMKTKFNFEKNIAQLFDFVRRKGDLLLFPVYQFDIVVLEVDYTVPYIDSGLCILSHRADYETIVFNIKLLEQNSDLIISTQAAIISLFSAYKRGKEVDTFEDVIEKGYKIEGMSSPDIMLPDTEEKFRKINSKLEPLQDLFGCVKYMLNDSKRFCVIDCTFSLSHFVGNLSGRSFASVTSNQSVYSASRPWSRISRRRWNDATLNNPLEASKTAWPVAHKESIFLPEFPITTDLLQKDFEIAHTIAKGAFGEVYKVKKLSENKEYALKVLNKSQVVSDNAVRQVKEEARIQAAVGHHVFIAGSVSRWQTKKRLYIVSEYIPGGELLALIEKYGKLPENLVKIFLAEIAIALDFLHNAGIIYRDLKPENILLDTDYHIRLIDFGLSKWLSIGSRTTTICGTLKYMVDKNSGFRPEVNRVTVGLCH